MSSHAIPPLLEVDHLARRFGHVQAVRDVDFSLQRGRVMGLLGINGAGKTTTLKLLAGILAPDRGRVRVAGRDVASDPRAQRELIAYAPEHPALHPHATPRESLEYSARLRGFAGARASQAVDRALLRCDLGELANRPVGRLSRGQQQRVGLAQALVHEPALILLDEPTAGLDPVQATATRAWIGLLREHAAVIVSTHLLGDVRACCDEVAVLHQGTIAFSGALDAWLADDAIEVRLDRSVDDSFWTPMAVAGIAMGEDARHWWITLEAERTGAISLHAATHEVGVTLLRPREDALERRFAALVAGREPVPTSPATETPA